MHHVELSRRAQRDLKKLDDPVRATMLAAMKRDLAATDRQSLDIKQLKGRAPWLRLRSGEYRILYRPLTRDELKALPRGPSKKGFLVERVVKRGDLDRAAKTLG